MRRLFLLIFLCPLAGCFIESELCGEGFSDELGRCVPTETPPDYYGDTGPIPPTIRDARMPEDSDAGAVDAETPPSPWARHTVVLVVDLGSEQDARRTPQTPGVDLDAVVAVDLDGRELGVGGAVVESFVNDPFRSSRCLDPGQALGPPNAGESRDPTVCLGTNGGFIAIEWRLYDRGLRPGDRIEIYEDELDGADGYGLYICDPEREISPRTCVLLGRASGAEVFTLP